MRTARIVCCWLVAALAFAQTDDIYQRLRQALGQSGQGELAAGALANKDFAKVERMLSEALAANQGAGAELLPVQGAVEFLAGKMAASASAFDAAAKLKALSDADAFTFAMASVSLGDDARARVLLSGLAGKYPQRAMYPYWLGRIDYDQRRYEEAVQKLKAAVELDPQSARIWDSLGLAFDMQGLSDQAFEAFQRAAALNRAQRHPSPWPPHNLGFLLLRIDKTKEAEAALRESLRYTPALPQTHYYLGRVLEKEGRETEAAAEYEVAIAGDTATPEPYYSLAMLYQKLHRQREAAAMFAEFKRRKQAVPDSATAGSPAPPIHD